MRDTYELGTDKQYWHDDYGSNNASDLMTAYYARVSSPDKNLFKPILNT
jgi:hypothetical protein